MFVDAEAMKEKLREDLLKPQYDVQDFYWKDGHFQEIATSIRFENITLSVIGLNALWIWIDTDYNHAETIATADVGFALVENCFCAFFTSELFIRFTAFENKRNCARDAWFVFDATL